MKEVCFYHGGCADGILSAAIIKKSNPTIECVSSAYGDRPDPELYTGATVYISDFSFEPEVMKDIHTKAHMLIWNDHHQTAKDKNLEMWNDKTIPGFRQMDKSGALLTWEYINPKTPVPILVSRTSDRDLWKYEFGEESAWYHEAFDYFISDPQDVLDCPILDDQHPFYEVETKKWIGTGKIIVNLKNKRVKKAFATGFEKKILGKRVWCMNSQTDISDIGNYACKHGYDAGIVFSKTGDLWHYSVRSTDGKTALEIATKYKGGGHPNAAAFRIKEYIL